MNAEKANSYYASTALGANAPNDWCVGLTTDEAFFQVCHRQTRDVAARVLAAIDLFVCCEHEIMLNIGKVVAQLTAATEGDKTPQVDTSTTTTAALAGTPQG